MRYPTFKEDPAVSLAGLRMRVEYFDLLSVDVTYSQDKKSFDARAILRSTYHQAFVERNDPRECPEAPGKKIHVRLSVVPYLSRRTRLTSGKECLAIVLVSEASFVYCSRTKH